MSRPLLLWPVIGDVSGIAPTWGIGPLAWFFEYGDAVDFLNSHEDRNRLFIGQSTDDERPSGYRAAPLLTAPSYAEWLAEVDGQARVAA